MLDRFSYHTGIAAPITRTAMRSNRRPFTEIVLAGFKEALCLRKATGANRPSGNYFPSHVTRVDHTSRVGQSI